MALTGRAFDPPARWDSHQLRADPEHVFVAAPALVFESSDLWHGAVHWVTGEGQLADNQEVIR